MSLWLLIGKVLVAWVFVSVGGCALFIGAAEFNRWRHDRRCTVTPLYPQSTHVRVMDRGEAS